MEANPLIAPGTVVAVCLSEQGGVPKHPQPNIAVGQHGVEGDYHSGPTRISRRTGQQTPNDRQVSIVAAEALEGIGTELGITIAPGGLGENILVRGLGNLGDVPVGAQLVFSGGVQLQVTAQNAPCSNLMAHHPLVPKLALGRRGLLAIVIGTGFISPGDAVSLVEGDSATPNE